MCGEELRVEVAAHLDAGGDPREYDCLPLRMACRAGPLELVERVLALGLTIDDVRACDNHALRTACANGRTAIVRRLLSFGLTIDDARADSNCALRMAANSGHLGVIDALIQLGLTADDVRTNGLWSLHAALWSGYSTIVDRLLSLGLTLDDARALDSDGRNALEQACRHDKAELVERVVAVGFTAAEVQAQCDRLFENYDPEETHGGVVAALIAGGAKPTPRAIAAMVRGASDARATLRAVAVAAAAWGGSPALEDSERVLNPVTAGEWEMIKDAATMSRLRFSE